MTTSPDVFRPGAGLEQSRLNDGRLRQPLTPDQIAARDASEASFIQNLGVEVDPRIPKKIAAARAVDPSITIFEVLEGHDILPDVLEDLDPLPDIS